MIFNTSLTEPTEVMQSPVTGTLGKTRANGVVSLVLYGSARLLLPERAEWRKSGCWCRRSCPVVSVAVCPDAQSCVLVTLHPPSPYSISLGPILSSAPDFSVKVGKLLDFPISKPGLIVPIGVLQFCSLILVKHSDLLMKGTVEMQCL